MYSTKRRKRSNNLLTIELGSKTQNVPTKHKQHNVLIMFSFIYKQKLT